jgi:hypothetical protein
MTPDPSTWSEIRKVPEQHAVLRNYIAGTWGDGSAFSVCIDEFRPAYKVPGRRRNGSVAGQHRLRWFFGRILLPLRNIVLSVIALPFANGPYPGFRTSKVTGPANCMALALADANNAEQQKLEVEMIWLVWTRNRAALVRVRPEPRFHLETLWQVDGPYRPQIDPPNRTLRWRDGSTVVLHLEPWEAKQATELPG